MVQIGASQENIQKLLEKYNTNSVPYISVSELDDSDSTPFLLDARSLEEYQISHLKNAIHIGYDDFAIEMVKVYVNNKDSNIVVYCSLGIRSEDIASQLVEAGYTNVKNLYGGIFEWKNQNKAVYNFKDQVTDSVHAFSRSWSKWLNSGVKVFAKE